MTSVENLLKFNNAARNKKQWDVIEAFCKGIGKQKSMNLANNKEAITALMDGVLVAMALSGKEMEAKEFYTQVLHALNGMNEFLTINKDG